MDIKGLPQKFIRLHRYISLGHICVKNVENVYRRSLCDSFVVPLNVNVEETSSHYKNIEETSSHCIDIEETSSHYIGKVEISSHYINIEEVARTMEGTTQLSVKKGKVSKDC